MRTVADADGARGGVGAARIVTAPDLRVRARVRVRLTLPLPLTLTLTLTLTQTLTLPLPLSLTLTLTLTTAADLPVGELAERAVHLRRVLEPVRVHLGHLARVRVRDRVLVLVLVRVRARARARVRARVRVRVRARVRVRGHRRRGEPARRSCRGTQVLSVCVRIGRGAPRAVGRGVGGVECVERGGVGAREVGAKPRAQLRRGAEGCA